ncbi:MAG: response regulator transcription factor [Chlorobi bacterium]|nr:response regulator transcription factor [Chlorobiota bacterium]
MGYRQKIVLVEPAYLIRAGLRKIISELPGMSVVETFEGNEIRLIDKILSKTPDVVIINPDVFKKNELISFINKLNNENLVLVGLTGRHTSFGCKSHFRYCLDSGESKYDLLEVLKKINRSLQTKNIESENTSLTQREKIILNRVVRGQTTQEIADSLFLSVHTVNTHRKNISNKLGIKTLSGLTVYALMNKIVGMDEVE